MVEKEKSVSKWSEVLEELKSKFIKNVPNIMVSIFIFIIFYVIANYCKELFVKNINVFQESNNIPLINNQIGWLLYYLVLIMGIIFAIVNLGISIATIITLLATIGLAFGLALQGTFGNIINGVLISIYDIFSIGDHIKINQFYGETFEGTVITFTLSSITIFNNKTKSLITLPNSVLQTAIITNVTRSVNY
jgi:small conductance mechanosensitive channel